ncbi:MaoC family dehydratase N-terminal domain-containing protein [Sphingomonas naphthae]|uniref:MaoC family dehydratase N-terminal domain-containing protein n=1 Tax=Sphingomonas naphthae TaxID=1813468 RepID=A0ABY7TSH0_9SPHN|nr:MaoC family dehydratase N-terminal domain-containing protein [Sphingomonas naphthae]WCT75179.1 MaoC family dehydratase N-terminal domain-containing protein [Sphingomonas naphthae]
MSNDFSAWAGRSEQAIDTLEPARSNALNAATGDLAVGAAGDPLPLLHHWLYFWDVRPPEGLGIDGHPARGGFLPPVPLPRRMWAGGRLKFLQPLLLGEQVARTSTILKVEAKSGKTGDLVFVTVRHELTGGAGLAIVEEQDIVYRGAAAPGSIAPTATGIAPGAASWRQDVLPDTILLFRYSALTMNGHRIHYDRPYAIDEEAYPALVVHGPLQATLLAALATKNVAAPVTGFDFRGQSPAFDGVPLHVCGGPTEDGASLWTEQGGTRNMVATIRCGAAA